MFATSYSRRTGLFIGVSAVALTALAAPALAQTATTGAEKPKVDSVGEVVVTARRKAIQSAIQLKAQSIAIVDSVTADDAGKLPDASVTEVLQRVVGVSISHFAAVGDPDHFSVEGSGVAVRGLSQVSSTLNGRESFSANSGRSLLWEDVPPELMAGVDVYKTATADQIEGGVGGSVDLRTHMPFDYKVPTFTGSVSDSYGDLVAKGHPSGSLLFTRQWDTSIGRVGFLVDAAFSEISSRADTLQVEPYFPETINNQNVYIPGGFDARTATFDRKRTGLYEATQWEPNDNLSFYQTGFLSDYRNQTDGWGYYNQSSNHEAPASGSTAVYGANGGLIKTSSLVYTNWQPTDAALCPTYDCGIGLSNTEVGNDHNQTYDFTEGFKWRVNDRLSVKGAIQYVGSSANTHRTDLFADNVVPGFSFDNTGGVPVFGVTNKSLLTTPSAYFWAATMDHKEDHAGAELAVNADAAYHVSDDGFLRDLKFGVRFANRTEKDEISAYNWSGLTPIWDYWSSNGLSYLSNYSSKYYSIANPKNFFQGGATFPGPFLMPSMALARADNILAMHEMFGLSGDTTNRVQYDPSDLTKSKSRNGAVYGLAEFASDNVFGMKLRGDVGLRVVYGYNRSSGSISLAAATNFAASNGTYSTDLTYVPNSGGREYVQALPSINLDFLPRSDVHVRLAASESLSNPSFSQASASGSSSLHITNGVYDGYSTGYLGIPNLKPQISRNMDLSVEWYLPQNGLIHAGLFYKSIKDYISYGIITKNLDYNFINSSTSAATVVTSTTTVSGYFNAATATVKGFEAGATKFFNFLPAPFDGLGIDANFTYIDSVSPGDLSYDMLGNKIHGLPVDLLSKYNYNLTGMYEKGPISFRLAYTWRSKYLLTPTANGTNGSYNGVTYNLPIFSDDYGQLDMGSSFKVNPHISVSFDAQNLTNSMTKTLMGYGSQQYGRSWFVSDRRYIAGLHFSF